MILSTVQTGVQKHRLWLRWLLHRCRDPRTAPATSSIADQSLNCNSIWECLRKVSPVRGVKSNVPNSLLGVAMYGRMCVQHLVTGHKLMTLTRSGHDSLKINKQHQPPGG